MLVHIISWPKKFESNKILVQIMFQFKNIKSRKIRFKKFGQNWVCNSRDIPGIDKCCRGKCYLHKCPHDSLHLFKMVPRTYLFGSVILLPLSFQRVVGGCAKPFLIELDWVVLSCGWVRVLTKWISGYHTWSTKIENIRPIWCIELPPWIGQN